MTTQEDKMEFVRALALYLKEAKGQLFLKSQHRFVWKMSEDSLSCSAVLAGCLGPLPHLSKRCVCSSLPPCPSTVNRSHTSGKPTADVTTSRKPPWHPSITAGPGHCPSTGLLSPRLRARQGQKLAFCPIFLGPNMAASTEKAASEL